MCKPLPIVVNPGLSLARIPLFLLHLMIVKIRLVGGFSAFASRAVAGKNSENADSQKKGV